MCIRMLRRGFALVTAAHLLGACGRVDSEPPAGPDAALAMTDAPTAADAHVRVADSDRDFAGTQGAGGWLYLYQEMPSGVRRELSFHDGAWVVDDTRYWTWVSQNSMHPNVAGRPETEGNAAVQLPVRRWLSDTAGAATIAFRAGRNHPAPCGDGVTARVIVDDVVRWERAFAGDAVDMFVTESLAATLGEGSTVDFVVDPLTNDGCDSTWITATIRVTPSVQ